MTINQDLEILKSVAIAREGMSRKALSDPKISLYCPLCGNICSTFENIAEKNKILYCRRCNLDYLISYRNHKRRIYNTMK